jgi:hypothetical protein
MTGVLDGSDPTLSWWIAIIVLLVVTAVVHVLLGVVTRTAQGIEETVLQIWVRGQRVANNTIHIANLYKTRDYVEAILGRAGRIAGGAAAIEAHAKSCPGCPQCMLSRR